jgi:hypothetical protein
MPFTFSLFHVTIRTTQTGKEDKMNVFKELSLQVHPDIVGNNSVNNDRMQQVIRFRANESMLIRLAGRWGVKLKGAPVNYSYNPYMDAVAFRTIFGSIYVIEERLRPTPFKNCSVKEVIDRRPEGPVLNTFQKLGLMPNFNYNGLSFQVLLRNKKIFKVVEVQRTTAKCVYGRDVRTGEIKRYNSTSLFGRRTFFKNGEWKN